MPVAYRRRHIDISSHLTPDELALLAEGKAEDAADRFRSHLAHCKSCFQAYQEAVEFHARALAGQEPHAPPELVKNGRNVPIRRGGVKGVKRAPRGRMIVATVGGLAALAAVWIFLGPAGSGGTQSRLTPDTVTAFRYVSGEASEQGLVFPEALWGKGGTTFRGEASLPPELGPVLEQLRSLAKEKKISSDDLFWLISAELATGDLEMARLHLQQAPVDSDIRFLKLQAILAYRESRLTDAEKDLRSILQKNGNDAESELNLALVLAELGKSSEALALLERARQSQVPQVAKRASAALDSLLQTDSR